MKRPLFFAFLFIALANSLFGQAKPGQVLANIPTENGTISVINEQNNIVNVKVGETNLALDAEEALRIAGWIKEGKTPDYTGKGPISLKREKNSFLLIMRSGEKPTEMRLKNEWAYQLAQALASSRMNVSEAGKP
jgi:hypothetical protein